MCYLCVMNQSGVRELGQGGRRVVEPPHLGELERLRAAGEVRSAAGDLDELPEPIPLAEGQQGPSVVLARLRRHD